MSFAQTKLASTQGFKIVNHAEKHLLGSKLKNKIWTIFSTQKYKTVINEVLSGASKKWQYLNPRQHYREEL